MTTFLQFLLIGLGPGAIYALAGAGIVVIYRGSGVLNFAHGAQALLSAQIFVWLWQDQHWPLGLALTAAVLSSAVVGLVIYVAAMRHLQESSPVVRLIATVGLLALIQQTVIVLFGTDLRRIPNFLPKGRWTPIDGAAVGLDRLTLLAVAAPLSFGLALLMRRSKLGMQTAAVADNRLGAATLGHSPHRVAAINWAIGSALAGLAGALIVPITGLGVTPLTLLVVPAFAAALLGGFSSFTATFAGALLLGIGQSLLTRYNHTPGGGDAFVFIVIIAVATLRGSCDPDTRRGIGPPAAGRATWCAAVARGHDHCAGDASRSVRCKGFGCVDDDGTVRDRRAVARGPDRACRPGVARPVRDRRHCGVGRGAVQQSLGLAVPGRVSLGVLSAVVASMAFAVPSLRSRGATLAVATLGLGLAVQSVIFGNPDLVGGFGGTRVERPILLGIDIGASRHPERFATFTLIVFGLVALALVNLRAGRVGRRLLAIRSNERAAASLGIGVGVMKVYAFGLAAAVAGIGGVLMAFRYDSVVYKQFDSFASLNLISFVVIGGIGYVGGSVVAAFMVPAGLIALYTKTVENLDRYLIMASGLIVIATLIQHPHGVSDTVGRVAERFRRPRGDEGRAESGASRGRSPTERAVHGPQPTS